MFNLVTRKCLIVPNWLIGMLVIQERMGLAIVMLLDVLFKSQFATLHVTGKSI